MHGGNRKRPRAIARRSLSRAGKLVPPGAKRLRGRSVQLKPGGMMDWHSTGQREELLIALSGVLSVERRGSANRISRMTLREGECAFLPSGTWHRVLNGAPRASRYVYVTG